MTLEEKIKALLEEQDNEGKPAPTDPPKEEKGTTSPGSVTITTADGEEITGDSYEAVARTLATRTAVREQPKTTDKPAWDDKEFAETFVKNPKAGLEYYEERQYGFKLRDALPVLLKEIRDLRAARTETEYDRFFGANADYEKNQKNAAFIAGVLESRNLEPTADNLELAWAYGKQKGLVEVKKGKAVEAVEEEAPPPRMPRAPRTTAASRGEDDPLSGLDRLSDERLAELVDGARNDLSKLFSTR